MKMDEKSDARSSSPSSRQNVSFKFTKKVSKTAIGNKLEDNISKSNIQTDYCTHISENKIRSSIPENKEKELVIPLIKKNNWRISASQSNNSDDPENRLNELAIQELLKECKEKNEQWENRDFKNDSLTIAMVMQNKVPEGFETDEKLDVSLRPKESSLEDYERVPVEKFGLAMLRGMGWKEGDPIGANCDTAVEPIQANPRPKGLGLGADASALNKAKVKKNSDEKLELIKGAYVRIIQGRNDGDYGEVLGLDEDNARVIVKLSGSDKIITFPEFSVEVVSKKEFEKESKVINRVAYEKYRKKQEESRKSEDKSKKASKRDKSPTESKRSKDDRKRSHDHSKESYSEQKERHSSKKRRSPERNSGSHKEEIKKTWLRPELRVRVIDDKYKKGKYFNEKVIVMDVLSPNRCVCKTENGKYLEDISPSMLETVIPRSDSSYVMIVQGKYSGEVCTILERNKSKCLATVQFLSDRDQALETEYDSICEYVGDVSQYD